MENAPADSPFTTELNVVGDKKAYCYHMGAGTNLENIAAASRSTTVYGDGKAETLAIDPYDAYQKELEDFIGHIEELRPARRRTRCRSTRCHGR